MAQIVVNIPSGMCFQIQNDSNPTIQGQYQYASQEYEFMKIQIYKALTAVTVMSTGSVTYWRC